MASPFTNNGERIQAINEALALYKSIAESGELPSDDSRASYAHAQLALLDLSREFLRQSVDLAAPEAPASQRWEYDIALGVGIPQQLNKGWMFAPELPASVDAAAGQAIALLRRPVPATVPAPTPKDATLRRELGVAHDTAHRLYEMAESIRRSSAGEAIEPISHGLDEMMGRLAAALELPEAQP